ncbi:NAD-dependent epimerase/dehydratase family protein [Candidatus Margulisiibacteriota bacterium]
MRILVTGGSGFLGKNLIDHLIDNGYEVINFDLSNNDAVNKKATFIKGDLLDVGTLKKALRNIDAVCHLGGIGDVYLAYTNPALAAMCNVAGTASLYEAALENKVQRIIYASTWEVYGKPQYNPVDEKHPTNPDHSYNITKYSGEQLALFYEKHKGGAKTLVLRLGTAYGRNMRPNSVFSLFINKAMKNEGITIQGDGKQFRQFIHAMDVAAAFRLAVESKLSGEILNIVSPEKVTIKQLAEMVAAKIPTKISFGPAREGDISSSTVSSEKASRLLGWKPAISFEQGLTDLIELFKQRSYV